MMLTRRAKEAASRGDWDLAASLYQELNRLTQTNLFDYNIKLCTAKASQLGVIIQASNNNDSQNYITTRNGIYHRPPFFEPSTVMPKQGKQFPRDRWPNGLLLPKAAGMANDYTPLQSIKNAMCNNEFIPNLKVSVVIPVYQRSHHLDLCLAAICRQDYPLNLIEVIVTDDGSKEPTLEEVVRKYEHILDIAYTWSPDRGYTLSRARNKGISLASGPIIILLDCDLLPTRTFIGSMMEWMHITDQAAIMAHREFKHDNDLTAEEILSNTNWSRRLQDITSENTQMPVQDGVSIDWRLPHYRKTENLKFEKYPFKFFASGHVCYPKTLWEKVGGYCEEFNEWGCEDLEFGYRLYAQGAYLIPELRAIDYHLEPRGGVNETVRDQSKMENLLVNKVPIAWRRSSEPRWVRKRAESPLTEVVPAVSILIPAYNAEKYLPDAIDSCLLQTYKDFEVVICDDGSTDRTYEIAAEYARKDKRISVVRQPNMGIKHARIKTFKEASGHYWAFLDADDIIYPNALEVAISVFESDKSGNIGVVYSNCDNLDSNGEKSENKRWSVEHFSREHLLLDMIVHHFRVIDKRYWYRTPGFSTLHLTSEDYEFFLLLADVCEFHHVNESLYGYRAHSDNCSTINMKKIEVQLAHRLSALSRMELQHWKPVSNDPDNPRKITFTHDSNIGECLGVSVY